MSNDPNLQMPGALLNYVMKNVCFGLIKNIQKQAKEVEKTEIFKTIMRRQERIDYYSKIESQFDW